MAKRSIDKQLLTNYIRHAGGHNKIQEEREMWRVRSLELKQEKVFDDWERKIRQPPLVRGHLVSDALDNDSRGYSSTPPSSPCHNHSDIGGTRPSCKRLMREKERDPFRWGHAGFKELYPEQFVSSDEERGRADEDKKVKGHSQKRKRKKEHKDRRKAKRRKLKPQDEKSETSSKRKRRKAKKTDKRRRGKEVAESSTSDSGEESRGERSGDGELEERVSKSGKKRTSRHKQ